MDAPKRIQRRREQAGESEFRRVRGPEVLPGTYTVRVSYGGQTAEGKVNVLGDPRFQVSTEARQANLDAMRRASRLGDAVADAVDRLRRTRTDVDAVTAQLRRAEDEAKKQAGAQGAAEDPGRKAVLDAARELLSGLSKLEKRFWRPEDEKGILRDEDLESRIGYVGRSLGSSWDAPTPAQMTYLERVDKETRQALDEFNRFYAEDVAAFRAKVRDAKFELLPEREPLKIAQ